MNAAEGITVIGKSVKILGDLSGSEDLVMDGEIHGTIHLPGARLTIGPSARCRADIVAQEVVIFGRLEGDIRAKGRVELRATAMVQGSIFAGGLSIEENAAFRGKVDPSRAGEPMPTAPVAVAESETGPVVLRPLTGSFPVAARAGSPMPAALAAVAARPSASSPEGSAAPSETPLFAETKN